MVVRQPKHQKKKSSDIFDLIDELIRKSKETIRHEASSKKIELYAEGLKDKLKQAQFAIERMNSSLSDTDSSSGKVGFSTLEKAHFYCDAFWAFSYSSLDVTAQIINQVQGLQFGEDNVSFKGICEKVDSNSPIRHKMERIRKLRFFKNLEKYRNCCLHRRSIYIKRDYAGVEHTAGYDVSSADDVIPGSTVIVKGDTIEVITTRLTLCDDPCRLTPRTGQNRELIEYCSKSFGHLCGALGNLLTSLLTQ